MKSKQKPTVLGISFRNNGHKRWFLIVTGTFILWLIIGTHQGFSSAIVHTLAINAAVTGLVLGIIAFCFTYAKGEEECDPFSIDCAWFNTLAGLIFLLVHFATR